jgi:hypothetical protein
MSSSTLKIVLIYSHSFPPSLCSVYVAKLLDNYSDSVVDICWTQVVTPISDLYKAHLLPLYGSGGSSS